MILNHQENLLFQKNTNQQIWVRTYLLHFKQIYFFNLERIQEYLKALFDLWKVITRSQAGKPPPKKPAKEPENELIRKQLEHKRNLHFYAQSQEKDIQGIKRLPLLSYLSCFRFRAN
ncbi:unnamed protein product [Paramecium pentaurelia]|uniref:Uncharacterized protein n=1 Tax=Paramecium pentaurelia TaxID=43138 RepID=A0A8S1VHU5_9CILI|nr:unnamed protein product [Paramecium pentaurelia]